jgi:hypothetical protein
MDFIKKINARYLATRSLVLSNPLLVDALEHDLTNVEKNKEAVNWLKNKQAETLHVDAHGTLKLYDTCIVYVEKGSDLISFFLTFQPLQTGIVLEHLWKDDRVKAVRINGLPLGTYCLFEEMLPRFQVVALGKENTPDGEKWTKHRTVDALQRGFHVYLTNEHGALFEAKTWDEVEKRQSLLWGVSDRKFLERTVVLSTKPLNRP